MLLPLSRVLRRHVLSVPSVHYQAYSTQLPPLPEPTEWRALFTARDRVSIRNLKTADMLAQNFLSWTGVQGPKVVIEAFPGPGALTRSLLKHGPDKLERLIVLEDDEIFLDYLRPLEEADPRVKVLPFNGYSWDTYAKLENEGYLDSIPKVPWDSGVHPSFQFISHIPMNVAGDQLVSQFMRCIPEKVWLFRFGRIPMNLIMDLHVWERSTAEPDTRSRCKLSVIADAAADLQLTVRGDKLLPYEDHWHPIPLRHTQDATELKLQTKKLGYPMVAGNIIPREEQVIEPAMLEKWDYCLRRLFVLKSQPLKTAISSLAPGAATLLKTLTNSELPLLERVDPSKTVRALTIKDWALLLRAFNNWPFAPQDLLINDGYSPSKKNFRN